MKKYHLLFWLIISINPTYGQERFFSFTEGWRSEKVVEYNSHFLSIGLGSTAPYQNHIQFTKLDKQGNYIGDWTFKLDSTSSTEFVNAQTIHSTDAGNMVISATTIYSSDLWTSTATPLKFNNDFTQFLNDTWFYNSSYGGPTQFRAGLVQNGNETVYAVIGSFNSTLNLVALKTNMYGDILWEQSYSCNPDCLMEPRHVIPAHDGRYIFTSQEEHLLGGGGVDDHNVATIIKTDSMGQQEWRIYPGGIGQPLTSEYILVIPTDDGNYLCAWADNKMRTGSPVQIAYNTNPDATIWFAKINPLGEKLWEKNIQQEIDLWDMDQNGYTMRQIIKSSDGNIVLTVSNKLVKITQDAEVIWIRSLKPELLSNPADPTSYVILHGLEETSDNGFICACEAWVYPGSVFPEFTQSGCIVKVDEYGCLEPDCHLNDPVSTTTTSANHAELKLFPNPAQDYITIEYDTAKPPKFIAVNITDLAGRVVYAQVLENQEQYLTIPTKDLPPGQYFCQLFIDGSMGASRKFVVVR